jgi:hypothetical protein
MQTTIETHPVFSYVDYLLLKSQQFSVKRTILNGCTILKENL